MLTHRQRRTVRAEPGVEHPAGHRGQGVGPALVGGPLVARLAHRGGTVQGRHHRGGVGRGQQGADPRHRVRRGRHPHAPLPARLDVPGGRGLGVQRELDRAHVRAQLRDGALVRGLQDPGDHLLGQRPRQVAGVVHQHLDLAHRDRPLVQRSGQQRVALQPGRELDLVLGRPPRDRQPGRHLVGHTIHLRTTHGPGAQLGHPPGLLPRHPRTDPLPPRDALDQRLVIHHRRVQPDQPGHQVHRCAPRLQLRSDRMTLPPRPGRTRHRRLRTGHRHPNTPDRRTPVRYRQGPTRDRSATTSSDQHPRPGTQDPAPKDPARGTRAPGGARTRVAAPRRRA